MRFLYYLNELSSTYGRGLSFFDVDLTLFDTTAKIIVKDKKTKKAKKELSNQEFNTYQLQPDEEFDFHQFRDASLFYRTSKPIDKVIVRLNRMIKMLKQNDRQSKICLLSARGKFDSEFTFMEKLRDHGIDTNMISDVILVGDEKGSSISQLKKNAIKSYVYSGMYRRVRLVDDDMKNLKLFLSLEKELPDSVIEKIKKIHNITKEESIPPIEFFALLVLPSGSLKRIKNEK
jgi:hypothetical protein